MTVRARYDGKNFVPIDPVDLPKDQVVELEVHTASGQQSRRGSPAAVLEAMRSLPHLEPGDADALEQSISQGKVPASREGIFDD